MENFDYRNMSKLTFPSGINETEYLRFEKNATWTASSRDMVCALTSTNIGYAVATLNAKLCPINCVDRDAMIVSLQEWTKKCQEFLDKYGDRPAWKSSTEVKDARRGIKRMEREIARLGELEFPL